MKDPAERRRRRESRLRHNEEFVANLRRRRPDVASEAIARAERTIGERSETVPGDGAPAAPAVPRRPPGRRRGAPTELERPTPREMVFEAIVSEERPVLFVESDWLNMTEVTIRGREAQDLVDRLQQRKSVLSPLMPLVGRIDVSHFPGLEYVGTGWLVAADIVVTNRHVALLIARNDGRKYVFSRGVGNEAISASLCTAHEFDDLTPDEKRIFAVEEVLYIEPDAGPNDIAFLKVRRNASGAQPPFISIAAADAGPDHPVLVVGYPARASKRVIPDQDLMKDLYRDRYDVKRAAPGLTMASIGQETTTRHDCTTLGGNSGSVVLDLDSGQAVGLHFAGLYQESNFAVRATVLRDYVTRRRWLTPPVIERASRPAASPSDGAPAGAAYTAPATSPVVASATNARRDASATIEIPLSITLTVGSPLASTGVSVSTGGSGGGGNGGGGSAGSATADTRVSLAAAESAAKAFWNERPDGVIAVRVGFNEVNGEIGDVPLIAASVPVNQLAAVQASGPSRFQTLEVRYFAADVAEQVAALPMLEVADHIAYDDDARTGAGFSFAEVDEDMTVLAHVGPEFSWEVLEQFLAGGKTKAALVSAIYEFHAAHIADALEKRLDHGASLRLVMDSKTFGKPRDPKAFDRVERFDEWETKFGGKFERVVVPMGGEGLVANSYHIKVTARDDDTFWLSSGNWKAESSQPIVTQEDRDNATTDDLPGNREWHVVIENKTLADRFRNHIKQDEARSEALGGGPLPRSFESAEIFVDVPIDEGLVLERRPPSRVLEPKEFTGRRKVKPLLTPDKQGEVYSEAVLQLIRSAQDSLLFQIPYIGMPTHPGEDRGFIDELITELSRKLKTLDDARVILRRDGSGFSAPAHAAWFFKSNGVDIASQLRQIEDSHTKGMIVDGKRVLIGSHNWSSTGVTLNRDASLLFDDAELAGYYAQAFEIDWRRSNRITPKKFVKESVILEATGDEPPPGFKRVPLSDLLKEVDD